MTREEKIVYANIECAKGSPIRDFLEDEEIEEALAMLADTLIALRIVNVSNLYEESE
jgi:hypothetical protein